ncbi:MAG: hypothetical protein AAB425_06025 [Bdellovibrionota bacterium]
MKRIILRLFNAPFLILIAVMGTAIQTSLFVWKPIAVFQPQITLLLVLWCAFEREFLEGGILTLILANLAEIHSAAISGLYLVSYMSIFLAVRGSAKLMLVDQRNGRAVVAGFAALANSLILISVLHLLKSAQFDVSVVSLVLSSLAQLPYAYFGFPLLRRFDWKTFKSDRAHQALEDESLIEAEGF